LKVGEGFVYDTQRQKPSKQLDIIVYNDAAVAPIYRRDKFVVVPSSAPSRSGEVEDFAFL
jgi:hypothetical protein